MAELAAAGVMYHMKPIQQWSLPPEERPGDALVPVRSVWDLVNTDSRYPAAIPILVKYLPRARHPVLRQGIARALTTPDARGVAGRTVLDELKSAKDPSGSEARWTLANALTVVAEASLAPEIEELITDPSFHDVHDRLKDALSDLVKREKRRKKRDKQ